MSKSRKAPLAGFTLAELLIAVMILGEIATFTIPKVLVAQKNSGWNAAAKEAAGMLAIGYQNYRVNNPITTSTKSSDFLNADFINYVSIKTSGLLDGQPSVASMDCAETWTHTCYVLHNGGVLVVPNDLTFGGTATTNDVYVHFDPDGKLTNSAATGPNKSVVFYIYTNGRLTSDGNTVAGSCNAWFCHGPNANGDPEWFSWN